MSQRCVHCGIILGYASVPSSVTIAIADLPFGLVISDQVSTAHGSMLRYFSNDRGCRTTGATIGEAIDTAGRR